MSPFSVPRGSVRGVQPSVQRAGGGLGAHEAYVGWPGARPCRVERQQQGAVASQSHTPRHIRERGILRLQNPSLPAHSR